MGSIMCFARRRHGESILAPYLACCSAKDLQSAIMSLLDYNPNII